MTSRLTEQIDTLVRERAELDARLASNSVWQALRIARDAVERGETDAQSDVRRFEAALAGNHLCRAREALDLAIASLTAERSAMSERPSAPPAAANPDPPARRKAAGPRQDRTMARIRDRPPGTAPAASLANGDDDLTRIRGIDAALAERMRKRGIRSFAEIAAWTARDVKSLRAALGVGNRISRDNWIEQAARLANSAKYATQPPQPGITDQPGMPSTLSAPRAATINEPQPGTAVREPAAERAADDLALISGVTSEMVEWLATSGVTRFSEIAAWLADDIACHGAHCGIGEAVRRHGWIEQAAILASGRLTAYAARSKRGEPALLVARPPVDAGERREGGPQHAALTPDGHPPMASQTSTSSDVPESLAPSLPDVPATTSIPAADEEPDHVARRRLAERIAAIVPAATARPAPHDASASQHANEPPGSAPHTLGSWSARTPQEEASHDLDSDMWSQIAEVPLTVGGPGEAGWLDIAPGEADVVIRHASDGAPATATAPTTAEASPRRERQPIDPSTRRPRAELPAALRPLSEEATVEIVTHGEPPRASRPTVMSPAPSAESASEAAGEPRASVRRFLKSLTGR